MSTSTSAAVFESYVRTPDFESVAARLELSPELWDIFARTELRASAAGIAGQLGVAPEIALLGLRELAAQGLLRKHVQRWHEYRRGADASAAPAASSVPDPVTAPLPPPLPGSVLPAVAEPPSIAPVAPPPAVPKILRRQPVPAVSEPPSSPIHTSATGAMMSPAAAPVPVQPRPVVRPLPVVVAQPREIRFTCKAKKRARPTEAAGTVRFAVRRSGVTCERPPAPPPASVVPAEGWRLRPLLDAIVRRGGGGVQGQLLAYRVFLRVPAELLDRAGLHSLNLAEADFVIRDAELHAAIRRSMCEVAGMADDSPAEPASCTVS